MNIITPTCQFCDYQYNVIDYNCKSCDNIVNICPFCLITYKCVQCDLSDSDSDSDSSKDSYDDSIEDDSDC